MKLLMAHFLGKHRNIACVCQISGLWTGRSAHRGSLWLREKVEEAGFGEVQVPGAACAPWGASGAEHCHMPPR